MCICLERHKIGGTDLDVTPNVPTKNQVEMSTAGALCSRNLSLITAKHFHSFSAKMTGDVNLTQYTMTFQVQSLEAAFQGSIYSAPVMNH